MERRDVDRWLRGYERAWRSPGTDALKAIFAPDVEYRHSPYERPLVGLEVLGRDWERQREGPDEVFELTWSIVAVEDNVAVVRLEVHYGRPVRQEYRDLWILEFAEDGRCRRFEEWPFWPSKGWTAPAT